MKKEIAVSGAIGLAFLTAAGVMGLALIGSLLFCLSSSSIDDDVPLAAESLPSTLPANTQMVIRLDPGQTDEVDAIADLLVGDESVSRTRADADVDRRISGMISAAMTTESDAGMSDAIFDWLVAEPSGEAFDHVDVGRPLVLTVVWRDDEFSRDFSSGVPIGGERAAPEGMAARLYVPSDDPEALVNELMAFGKEMRAAQVIDISTRDGHATIDVAVYQPWLGLREMGARPDWDALLGDEDDAYWRRDTPAMRGFIDADAPVALHVRTEALASQRVYHWLGHYDYYHSSTPEGRAAGLSSLIASATLSAKFHDPSAREFDDHTLVGRVDDANSFEVEIYSTHTERGEDVHGQAFHDVEIPAIEIDDPVAQVEWNFDLQGSINVAEPPQWMTDPSVNDPETLVDQALEEDVWLAFLAHPMATNRGILEASEDTDSLEWTRGLLAARLVIADSGEPIPVEDVPPFAATAALALDSPVAGHVDDLIAEGEETGVFEEAGLFVDIVDAEDHRVLQVATGELRDAFGDDAAVEPLAVDIDTESAQHTLEWLAELRLSRTLSQWLEHPLVETGQKLSAKRHLSPEASAIRLALGDEGDKTLEIPTGSRGGVDSEAPSDCYLDVVATSRSGLGGRFGRHFPYDSDRWAFREAEGPSEFAHRMHEEMRKARNQCNDDARADELDYLLARWTTYRALTDAAHLRHNDARRWMDEACNLGDSSACERRQTLKDWAIRAPESDRWIVSVDTSVVGTADDLSPLVITTDGVGPRHFTPFERHSSSGQVGYGELSSELPNSLRAAMGANLTTLSPSEGGDEGILIASVIADRRVDSKDMASVVDIYANRTEEIIESRPSAGDRVPDKNSDIEAVAIAVDAASTGPDIRPSVLFALDDTPEASVHVELSSRGVALAINGGAVAPIDGCPQDGPTLCVEDTDAVESLVGELRDDGDHDVYDRLADHYRLASLAELVDEHTEGAVDGVLIATADDLPFGLVATAAAHIWSADAVTIGDGQAPDFHFRTIDASLRHAGGR